ncbi:MAG TPA: DUF4397 domain-containing protein [Gemmatimonadales bacterium]
MKLKMLTLLLTTAALVSACSDDDGTGPEQSGRVRVVHLSPDAPNVDVLVDGLIVASDVPYLLASDYLELEAGAHAIEIRPTGSSTTVLEQNVTVADGSDYTVLAGGELSAITLDVLEDDNALPASGSAKVRLIHAAPSAGLVDIYVTAPGADLGAQFPSLVGIDFGDVSPYIEVPAGDYQVRVTPTGALDVVIDTGTLPLGSGQIRTGIAVDAPGGGAPYDALILEDLN